MCFCMVLASSDNQVALRVQYRLQLIIATNERNKVMLWPGVMGGV